MARTWDGTAELWDGSERRHGMPLVFDGDAPPPDGVWCVVGGAMKVYERDASAEPTEVLPRQRYERVDRPRSPTDVEVQPTLG